MTNDTRTCDACGTRFAFTSYKDRCPDKNDESDDYELVDETHDDD